MSDPMPELDPTPPARWSTWKVLALLLPLFLYWALPLGFWPRQIGANSSAHAYTAMAYYFRGEACVDDEVRDFMHNQDLIYRNGHYYSNKPPGPAMWLVPAAVGIDLLTSERLELIPLLYFGRVVMLTLVFVVFLLFLGRTLERFASPAVAWGLTLAYALGTNAGVYATHYLSHDLAAMGLGTGFLVLLHGRPRWCWLGGLATGFAVLCEYQVVGIAVVLAVFSLFAGPRRFNWKTALSFGLGAVPMAVLLFAYNYQTSGTVAELAYQTEFQHFELESGETLGFTGPSPIKLFHMAFGPAVGLFFFSPWLLLVFPAGVLILLRRWPYRCALITALAAPVALGAIIASHEYWIGGAIAGPRYLTACLPFFLFPIAAFLNRVTGRWRTISLVGLAATAITAVVIFAAFQTVSTLVNTDPEGLDLNPLTSFVFPLAARGLYTLTVANILGVGADDSLKIHVLLLLTVVTVFAVFWFRGSSWRTRAVGLGCLALGGVLFAGWIRIGASTSGYSEFHLDRSERIMNLRRQPTTKDGRIRFVRRLELIRPPRKITVGARAFHPSWTSLIPEKADAVELVRELKSLYAVLCCTDGSVLLSDAFNNTIHRYSRAGELTLFLDHAGISGAGVVHLQQPGVNSLAFDREERLLLAEAGRRRVVRREPDGATTVIADRFEGKRLSAPHSLTVRSDGTIFFSDPRFRLRETTEDVKAELDFSGIYRWRDGELTLVHRDLKGPTALALSADERYLYVTDREPKATAVMRFEVDAEGNLTNPKTLCQIEEKIGASCASGLVLDRRGNLYVAANMSLWVLSPGGAALVMVQFPRAVLGLAWGGDDGKTLHIAAHSSYYRLRTHVAGIVRPALRRATQPSPGR